MDQVALLRASAVLAAAGLLIAAWKWFPAFEPRDLSIWLVPYRHAWHALPIVMLVFVVFGVVPVVPLMPRQALRSVRSSARCTRWRVASLVRPSDSRLVAG